MGERTTGLILPAAHAASPQELERDVDVLRGGLTAIVRELDHRRHDLMNWRLQAKRHRGVVVAVGAGLLVLGSLVVWRLLRPRRSVFGRRR